MKVLTMNVVFLFAIIMPCCVTKSHEGKAENNYPLPTRNSNVGDIILVNAKGVDRCGVGELIQSISKCQPKAIGINYLFVEEKEPICDSTLRAAIINADNVVLVEGFENGTHVESNSKFTSVAFLSAPNGLMQEESGVTEQYYRMIDYRGKWEISFPFLLALQLNKSRAAELSSKLTPQDYTINFYHRLEEFIVLDHDTRFSDKCNLLKDKIVLVGSLGPTDEDLYITQKTMKSSDKTYGTVVIANVILDILKELN